MPLMASTGVIRTGCNNQAARRLISIAAFANTPQLSVVKASNIDSDALSVAAMFGSHGRDEPKVCTIQVLVQAADEPHIVAAHWYQ